MKWVYVFVRTDLPLNDLAPQLAHACLEAGRQFQPTSTSVVIVGVKNTKKLIEAADLLDRNKINYYLWEEPEWGYGYTSMATEPLDEDKKNLFKSFKTLKSC